MEAMDELIIEAVAFFCGVVSAWMCLGNRIDEISEENDFILRQKEDVKACWENIEEFIQDLHYLGEDGIDRDDMDRYKSSIEVMKILMEDEWRLKL